VAKLDQLLWSSPISRPYPRAPDATAMGNMGFLLTVIALFFKLSFHLFSQPRSMFTHHGHSLLSQVLLVYFVFWLTPNSYDPFYDYTFLFLPFTYSSFTLFHSRSSNIVSFISLGYILYYSMLLRLRLIPSLHSYAL